MVDECLRTGKFVEIDPGDIPLPPEPGELALGKAAGIPLDQADSLLHGILAVQRAQDLSVTYALHGDILRSQSLFLQALHFFNKSLFHHPVHPGIDPFVEFCTVHGEDKKDSVVGRSPHVFAAVMLGNAQAAALLGEFQGPDDPLDIVGMNGLSRLRIHLLQALIEGLGPAVFGFLLHCSAAVRVGIHFREVNPVEEGLDIKARASHKEGQTACPADLLCGLPGSRLEAHDIPGISGISDVDQIVGDPLHLFFCDLGGAYVHAAVDLHGVGGNDAAAHPLCEFDGSESLSGRCRARYDDQRSLLMFRSENVGHCIPLVPVCDHTMRLNLRSTSYCVMTIMVGLPWGQW